MLTADVIDHEGGVGQAEGEPQTAEPADTAMLAQPDGRRLPDDRVWMLAAARLANLVTALYHAGRGPPG